MAEWKIDYELSVNNGTTKEISLRYFKVDIF
jgi:hypothetical protein